MPKPAKKRLRRGTDRMRDLGYRSSFLWYSPEEHAAVKEAAAIAGVPMTQFAIRATRKAVRETLGELNALTVEMMKKKGGRYGNQ